MIVILQLLLYLFFPTHAYFYGRYVAFGGFKSVYDFWGCAFDIVKNITFTKYRYRIWLFCVTFYILI